MGGFTVERSRLIGASVADVWAVVADVAGYHEMVETLAYTEVVSGQGVGLVRHCVDTRGREWYETCTAWEEGHRFTMTVDIDTYPAAFRALFAQVVGTWAVEPVGRRTRLTVRFEGRTRLGPAGRAAVALLGRDSVLEGILDRYEQAIVARLPSAGHRRWIEYESRPEER